MLRRALTIGGIFVGLLLVVAAIGVGWFVIRQQAHLEPPPNPPGRPSIARYSADVSLPAKHASIAMPAELAEFDWSRIDDPPVMAYPWTRWWWPGGDVSAETTRRQLDVLHEAGFGGVEIQPFLGGMINVADNDQVMARVYAFDSPAYYETLDETLMHAAEIGLQVDLTHFSGWPPGGPEILLEDSNTILAYGEVPVSGGKVSIELPRPSAGLGEYIFAMLEFAGADFINFPADHARLLSVVAARVESGKRRGGIFQLDDTVRLEADSLQVITQHVSNGRLQWNAPEGEWLIIASYVMPSGEVPMGSAQKPQGFVVDHLRKPQVIGHYEYAYGERTGLPRHYGKALRGFFNDSLEFRLRRMTVEDILPEFRSRRGYDLEPYLPAVYVEGIDNVYFRELLGVHAAPEFEVTPLDERIRHDYQQTLSDLVIERFVETSADWAHARGLLSRGQSYGMDIDLLRALGANSIPETEQLWAGGANVGLKFASSAAALYGRPLVSAESFVWINRDYQPTARRLKAATDKLLLAGVNHIVYHGTPYPWQGSGEGDYGEEGWQPFSGPKNPAHFSGLYGPPNTALWPDIPELNAYIARSQYLLRQGAPSADVLVYYPFLGFHGPNRDAGTDAGTGEALVAGSLPDADPLTVALEAPELSAGKAQLQRLISVPSEHRDPRVSWVEQIQPLLAELERRGVSWAWLNDHALQGGKLHAGDLTASDGRYGAILLPEVEALPPATVQSLREQIDQGIEVVFAGRLPDRQHSFHAAEAGDMAVRRGVAQLRMAGAPHFALDDAGLLSHLVDVSNPTLRYSGVSAINRHRRLLGDGAQIHFFANQSPDAAELRLEPLPEASAWWFDARTGRTWAADAGSGPIFLGLAGFDSRFLITGVPIPDALRDEGPPRLDALTAQSRQLTGWDFDAAEYRAALDTLPDWRDIGALKYARGPGVYRHIVDVEDTDRSARYILDLGLVQGSAVVSVNGERVGRASLPPFRLDISDAVRPGANTIEVAVTPPLRNYFVGRALAGDPLYSHMSNYENQLVAAGLMGPVMLSVSGAR